MKDPLEASLASAPTVLLWVLRRRKNNVHRPNGASTWAKYAVAPLGFEDQSTSDERRSGGAYFYRHVLSTDDIGASIA
jgi:hypothetical protein